MKKIFITVLVSACTFSIQAQTSATTTAPTEDKAAIKTKQDDELNQTLKELALTDDQAAKVKDILKDAAKRSSELKKDTTLTEAAKAEKKEEINTEKNDKLKQVMGAEKYRQWNAIRKRNKDKIATTAPATTN